MSDNIKSLANSAVRFRLRNSSMSNEELATYLKVDHPNRDYMGIPGACLYEHGVITAIRVSDEEVAIFYLFKRLELMMEDIADRIEKPKAA